MDGGLALLIGNFIMPTTDIYARTNSTRSGHPNTRFQVIIKISKARFEELRQLPENRDQTDNQLLSKVSGQVITILCPEPGASFSVASERLSEGEIPNEIQGRTESGTQLGDLMFWSI
jgi:hypothetical protein